jgi:hypothetical protein
MPLVPDASNGRCGVLSQTSTRAVAQSGGRFKHLAYLGLSRFIPGMCFATENYLEWARVFLEGSKPVQIGEE